MTTVHFLTEIQRLNNLPSIYALAKYMRQKYGGWTRASASNYFRGKTAPSNRVCLQIAQELGLPDGYVLACINAEREESPEVRDVWRDIAAMLKGTAAAFAVVILSSALPGKSLHAAPRPAGNEPALYIMSNWLRRIIHRLRAFSPRPQRPILLPV